MKEIMILFLAILVTGCAAYEPYKMYGTGDLFGRNTGYNDFQIKDNKYHVTYTGGTGSSQSDAVKYMYMRAKDLCMENGFNDFDVSNNILSQGASTTTSGGQGLSSTQSQPVSSADVTCK